LDTSEYEWNGTKDNERDIETGEDEEDEEEEAPKRRSKVIV